MSEAANDLALLQRYAREGDADAFAALCKRYAGLVFAAARRVTGSAHDAEDIAQACFLELARRAGEVKTSVAGWLHALAVNRARNRVRDESTRAARERESLRENTSEEPTWNELSPIIDEAISELPEDLRLPLVLHYLFDRTQEQIAEELNLSQPTVSRKIRSAVEKLRGILSRCGVAPSIGALSAALPMASARGEIVPAVVTQSIGKLAISGIGATAKTSTSWLSSKVLIAALLAIIASVGTLAFVFRGESSIAPTMNSSAVMRREAQRTWIDNVKPLIWGSANSGQRTMLGALAKASSVTPNPRDYTQLIGESGLAFRVRWRRMSSAQLDPYAISHDTDDAATRAIERALGHKLIVRGRLSREQRDPIDFENDITRSVEGGWPVVSEDVRDTQFGVIFGRDAKAQRWLMRDYYLPDAVREPYTDELGGGAIFFGEEMPSIDRKAAFISSMHRAVEWWRTPANDQMYFGDEAFVEWAAAVRVSEQLPRDIQELIWRQSWWNYDIVCDSHFHAAKYLRRNAELFSGDAQQKIIAAAEAFEALERNGMVDSVYKSADGPFTKKTYEDWVQTRRMEAELIGQVRAIHGEGISKIEDALREIENTK